MTVYDNTEAIIEEMVVDSIAEYSNFSSLNHENESRDVIYNIKNRASE